MSVGIGVVSCALSGFLSGVFLGLAFRFFDSRGGGDL